MNKLIDAQLKKVEKADLSHYDADANVYMIPKKNEIKIEVNKCYLVELQDTIFDNESLKTNWNNGNMPKHKYLKVDVSNIMAKMIKVVSVAYDYEKQQDIPYFWNGWLTLNELKVIQEIV